MVQVTPVRVEVGDASSVPGARRAAVDAAAGVGLAQEVVDRVALVATELAENLHRHAGGGALLLVPGTGALTVLSVDSGPGVRRFDRCLEDGYSTAGSMGVGLGVVVRQSDRVEALSEPGRGTVLRVDIGSAPPRRVDVAGLGFPLTGEVVNGDAWASARTGGQLVLLLADGLGHGEDAAQASALAVRALDRHAGLPAEELLGAVHHELRASRGAAVTVVCLDEGVLRDGGEVHSAGLGNVTLLVADAAGTAKRVGLQHGTAGSVAPRTLLPQTTELGRGGLLVLHTDGLHASATLEGRPLLLNHSALVVAATLLRDHGRVTDDTGVLVARWAGEGS